MINVFRTSAFQCPRCEGSPPLREFANRYICDACNGMLIAADDFVAAIHEIDHASGTLTYAATHDAGQACPRCTHPMSESKASVGTLQLAEPVMHCAQGHLWLSQNALAATFARVSRRVHGGAAGARDPGVYAPVTSGGIAAAISSIHDAFTHGGPATSGLAIANWHSSRPRVHTLFVSAYKDRRLGCPGCPSCKEVALEYRGDRWACTACAGSFVENAALSAMVSDMRNAPWEFPVVVGSPGERACPICASPMLVEVLEAVTTDRCAKHGVWFDDRELEAALHHATGEPTSIGGWVKRLFHRHGKIEDRQS